MGFESIISGHIAVHTSPQSDAQVELLRTEILKLPKLNDDSWPFLPQDIFHISTPNSSEANPVQISYSSIMISFAMSVKQIDDDLRKWINKFEVFLKGIPRAYEAKVIVKLDPFTGGGFNDGYLNYFWQQITEKNGNSKWCFEGDPIELKDFLKIRRKESVPMTSEFQSKIITYFEWLSTQVGKSVTLDDYITHSKGNYNKDFAQHTNIRFNLNSFGLRARGTVARIEGNEQYFEFKTDCITSIEKSSNTIEIEMDLGIKISRRVIISIEGNGDTR